MSRLQGRRLSFWLVVRIEAPNTLSYRLPRVYCVSADFVVAGCVSVGFVSAGFVSAGFVVWFNDLLSNR